MTNLGEAELTAIHPAVVKFDEQNELLAWIADLSVGASKTDQPIFEADKFVAFANSLKLLRSREGKPLRDLMKLCGKIALQEEVDENSTIFRQAAETIIIDAENEEAFEQASIVINRFSKKEHLAEFNRLYATQPMKRPAKKTARPKVTKPKPAKKTPDQAASETVEPVIEKAGMDELKTKASSSFIVRETTIISLEGSEEVRAVDSGAFAEAINREVSAFIQQHGGEITANRVYRFIESQLPGITREEARSTVWNIMNGRKPSVFRAGAREGSLVLTSIPERAGALDATSNKATKVETSPTPEEDLSSHELIPQLKLAISNANRDKGIPIKTLILQLGLEDSEVRRVIRYLVETGEMITEERKAGSGLSKGSTYKKMVRFASRERLQAFLDTL